MGCGILREAGYATLGGGDAQVHHHS
jgi:hypothetical protein